MVILLDTPQPREVGGLRIPLLNRGSSGEATCQRAPSPEQQKWAQGLFPDTVGGASWEFSFEVLPPLRYWLPGWLSALPGSQLEVFQVWGHGDAEGEGTLQGLWYLGSTWKQEEGRGGLQDKGMTEATQLAAAFCSTVWERGHSLRPSHRSTSSRRS